ncbi:hypothetical protein NG2371_03477 [Nocardia gamkensis]|nr:hypothetical protein [Nocardia gamkensis]
MRKIMRDNALKTARGAGRLRVPIGPRNETMDLAHTAPGSGIGALC